MGECGAIHSAFWNLWWNPSTSLGQWSAVVANVWNMHKGAIILKLECFFSSVFAFFFFRCPHGENGDRFSGSTEARQRVIYDLIMHGEPLDVPRVPVQVANHAPSIFSPSPSHVFNLFIVFTLRLLHSRSVRQ